MRKRDADRALRRATSALEVRLQAGAMAVDVELERLSDGMVSSSRSVREAILNPRGTITVTLARGRSGKLQFSKRASDERRRPAADDVDTNAFRDVWSPSKSVLHLAGPLLVMKPPLNVVQLAFEPAWVLGALRSLPSRAYALSYAQIVLPEELIMLRPEPSAQN